MKWLKGIFIVLMLSSCAKTGAEIDAEMKLMIDGTEHVHGNTQSLSPNGLDEYEFAKKAGSIMVDVKTVDKALTAGSRDKSYPKCAKETIKILAFSLAENFSFARMASALRANAALYVGMQNPAVTKSNGAIKDARKTYFDQGCSNALLNRDK
ncbi:MAG: hypothetical protein HN578_06075 [Rhodospirillales bacterium]|jgi:hypothetical protein|nr:hypothetical protein [Rhodospirillaceae bacterium]MBT8002465.1 hypothetical protein [Rhodospirillales bacterium]